MSISRKEISAEVNPKRFEANLRKDSWLTLVICKELCLPNKHSISKKIEYDCILKTLPSLYFVRVDTAFIHVRLNEKIKTLNSAKHHVASKN